MNELLLGIVLAFIGGSLGASIGALGGFILFGLLGVVGYFYLLLSGSSLWLETILSSSMFLPSICFLGGAIATAYSRKNGYIECGKDIGRSLISLRKLKTIGVGGVAGVIGFLTMKLFSIHLSNSIDIVALTVILIPLLFKYLWKLTKTNDCEGSSHVVASPYRFFERLSSSVGKNVLAIVLAPITMIITTALLIDTSSESFAGSLMFFLSALSLYLLFFNIPIPATHHLTGTVGVVVVQWYMKNEFSLSVESLLLPMLWAIAIALLAQLGNDLTKRFLFDEGDIHIDPPAGGIIVGTVVAMTILPQCNAYTQSTATQIVIAVVLAVVSLSLSLTLFREK